MKYVDVVYVPYLKQPIERRVPFLDNLTVSDVLKQSGILDEYPEVALATVGIFSVIVTLDKYVLPFDRVELYRPLLIDPKEKRRNRAKKDLIKGNSSR